MSMSLAFIISMGMILLFFGCILFNHFKSRASLVYSSIFVLLMYCFGHFINSFYYTTIPFTSAIETYYLFFAAMQALLIAGLFILNRNSLGVMMTITLIFLSFEVVAGYAVHVDRNIVALNSAVSPNILGESKWWLWDIRNFLSQVTNVFLLLSLTVIKAYQVTTEDPTEAYDEAEDVEAYLEKFKPSERVAKAKAFANLAAENLCFHDGIEKNQHKAMAGTMLLNEAIKQCCYEPGKTAPVGFFGRFVYWLRS